MIWLMQCNPILFLLFLLKWCKKSEIGLFWCICITNNVKSYQKFNESAQTAKFSVFTKTLLWSECDKTLKNHRHQCFNCQKTIEKPLLTMVWMWKTIEKPLTLYGSIVKTLPEAQRTQGIEFKTWVISAAWINTKSIQSKR